VDLEFHQLDLRYQCLRVRQPARERRLLASIADIGQQTPIVVVRAHDTAVVVDGYKRIRCLQRLHRDTVDALAWEMSEAEALIFRQRLHTEAAESALEQGWLLRTLCDDHAVSMEQLARRFDRSVSWVSRRLALVRDLPPAIQDRVQEGGIVAHAAMKYLVPLARANQADCLRLVEAIAARPLSTRQVGRLYQTYLTGTAQVRELVVTDPWLVLRVDEEAQRPATDLPANTNDVEAFIRDVQIVAAVARRATRRLRDGLGGLPPDRERAGRACEQAQHDVEVLHRLSVKELADARPRDANGDSRSPATRPWRPADCARLADLPRRGAHGAGVEHAAGAAD
jgi:ParB family transcriptional regulator, chromosome partitioning protein